MSAKKQGKGLQRWGGGGGVRDRDNLSYKDTYTYHTGQCQLANMTEPLDGTHAHHKHVLFLL